MTIKNIKNQSFLIDCEVVDSQPIGLWKAYQMCIKKYEIKDKHVASVTSFNMTLNGVNVNNYAYVITYASFGGYNTSNGVITIDKGVTRNNVLTDLKRIINIFPNEWIVHWSLEKNDL